MFTIKVDDRRYAIQGIKDAEVENPEALINKLKQIHTHHIVLLNAKFIAGRRHIELLLKQTVEAEKRGLTYAKQREIDLMARVACETQLKKAIDKVGLKPQKMDLVALVLDGDNFPSEATQILKTIGTFDDSVIELKGEKVKLLLSEHNLTQTLESALLGEDALAYLIAEKAALLACEYDF
ncbi:MAG: KEOPS complex subunit Cgi121 [Nitrososphaerales archaeon]